MVFGPKMELGVAGTTTPFPVLNQYGPELSAFLLLAESVLSCKGWGGAEWLLSRHPKVDVT